MFNVKKNMPDAYVRESRDFQLMCNLYNITQMATKFDIDSILNLTNTKFCNDTTLKLLQTKLGFFTNYELMGEDLRTLLTSFPYLIRKKGTTTGIKQCIQLFFKIIDKTKAVNISIINKDKVLNDLNYDITSPIYIVNINMTSKKFDVTLLTEMLRYIIPAGYGLKYYFFTPNEYDTPIYQKDTINIVFITRDSNSVVTNSDNKNNTNISNINTLPITDTKEYPVEESNNDT